jgi:hypothetical protein
MPKVKIKKPKMNQMHSDYMKSVHNSPIKGLSSEKMPSKMIHQMETKKKKKSIFG